MSIDVNKDEYTQCRHRQVFGIFDVWHQH